jgi:hypothetical protein
VFSAPAFTNHRHCSCRSGPATDTGWPTQRQRVAMTSPHDPLPLPHDDEQHSIAPAPAPPTNVTLSYAGTAAGYADPFSALAATATLATLSDTRDDALVSDDDDEGGGISLDLNEPPPAPPALLASTLGSAGIHMQAAMAHLQSFAHDAIPPPTSDTTSFHMNHVLVPPPPPYLGHLSSSEPSLEPLPAWPEAYLSIKDNSQFVPITSFFHYLTPEKSTVPGLDLVKVPDVIKREHLQGDKYDFQGIDWSVRNTTRSSVRSKRRECERERLSPSLKETRTVSICRTNRAGLKLTWASITLHRYPTQTASSPSGETPPLIVLTSLISSCGTCSRPHLEMMSSTQPARKCCVPMLRALPQRLLWT